jgi:phosphate acetyltransferase
MSVPAPFCRIADILNRPICVQIEYFQGVKKPMESVFLTQLKAACQVQPGAIVMPEQEDLRIIHGARKLIEWGAVNRVILFSRRSWEEFLTRQGLQPNQLLTKEIVFAEDLWLNLAADTLASLEKKAAVRPQQISDGASLQRQAALPLNQACQLVHDGNAEAGIAGAVHPTSAVIKAALNIIGLRANIRTLSGSFIMRRERPEATHTFIYADAGVVVDPGIDQLVEIASESVRTWNQILSGLGEPVLAFLSFSSKGSARHPSAEKMAAAAKAFQERYPHIACDGELQFDAAFDREIGARKAPGSEVPGRANIFVFPNLDAGNLCYKITERLGGFAAYGPILQGLKLPFCDLSRGCSVEDIAVAGCISLLRAKKAGEYA